MSAVNETRQRLITTLRYYADQSHPFHGEIPSSGRAYDLDVADHAEALREFEAAVRAEALAEVRAKVVDLPLMVGPDGFDTVYVSMGYVLSLLTP